jgi:hypothetical protein
MISTVDALCRPDLCLEVMRFRKIGTLSVKIQVSVHLLKNVIHRMKSFYSGRKDYPDRKRNTTENCQRKGIKGYLSE